MGIIRFLLAFCVVFAHFPIENTYFLNATFAVQTFYIFSGFYITLILQNNNYNSYKEFILSRYLRLFPIYFTCIIITFVANKGNTIYGTNIVSDKLNFFPSVLIIFTNITMFLQDLLMFIGINNGSLNFVTNFENSYPLPLYKYLYVPQGWTLGLELTFYLVAPFLLNKINIKKIIIIIFISLSLRVLLIYNGLIFDPWNYRFFPNEIIFFLLGSVSYLMFVKKKIFKKTVSFFCFFLIIFFLIFYNKIKLYTTDYIFIFLYFFIIISIPSIFNLTKYNSLDRFFGNLSYPIYCSHFIAIGFCIKVLNIDRNQSYISGLLVLISVLLLSAILNKYLQAPVDKFRKKFKKGKIPINN